MTAQISEKAGTRSTGAEVRCYQIGLERAAEVVKRGRPLSECEMAELEVEAFDLETFATEVRPRLMRPIDGPALTGEQPAAGPIGQDVDIFPPVIVEAPCRLICWDLKWAIVLDRFGRPQLVVRCDYICIPTRFG